jgi:hypothetical protein
MSRPPIGAGGFATNRIGCTDQSATRTQRSHAKNYSVTLVGARNPDACLRKADFGALRIFLLTRGLSDNKRGEVLAKTPTGAVAIRLSRQPRRAPGLLEWLPATPIGYPIVEAAEQRGHRTEHANLPPDRRR